MAELTTISNPPIRSAAKEKHKIPLSRILRKYWVFYVMMLPGIIILIANNYAPMVGILVAFKDINYVDGLIHSPWYGMKNFVFLFQTNVAWTMTRNTLLYNSLFIFLNLIFPVGFAILFNELRNKYLAKFYQSAMFLPFFLSFVVVSYLGFAFLSNEHGYLNHVILPLLGLDPIEWYTSPEYWPYILPLVNLWKGMGYFTVIYLAAIIGIDKEYYEAAVIDGASKWQQVRSITIPQLAPIIIVMTLLQIGRIFYADFGLFYQVTLNSGILYPTTQVIDTYVYTTFRANGNIGMAAAAGMYQAIVGFILVLVANLVIRRVSKENALF